MFKTAGKKIKERAFGLFCILSTFGVCGAYLFWKIASELSDRRIATIIFCVMLAFYNISISYTISLIVYGFGNIAEKYEEPKDENANKNVGVDANIDQDD